MLRSFGHECTEIIDEAVYLPGRAHARCDGTQVAAADPLGAAGRPETLQFAHACGHERLAQSADAATPLPRARPSDLATCRGRTCTIGRVLTHRVRSHVATLAQRAREVGEGASSPSRRDARLATLTSRSPHDPN